MAQEIPPDPDLKNICFKDQSQVSARPCIYSIWEIASSSATGDDIKGTIFQQTCWHYRHKLSLFSENKLWKLIHCEFLAKHCGIIPVSFFLSFCKRRDNKRKMRQRETRKTPEGSDVGQCMWAKLWESEPPPAHQISDYKWTPHIYICEWVGHSYIWSTAIAAVLVLAYKNFRVNLLSVLILIFKVQTAKK